METNALIQFCFAGENGSSLKIEGEDGRYTIRTNDGQNNLCCLLELPKMAFTQAAAPLKRLLCSLSVSEYEEDHYELRSIQWSYKCDAANYQHTARGTLSQPADVARVETAFDTMIQEFAGNMIHPDRVPAMRQIVGQAAIFQTKLQH